MIEILAGQSRQQGAHCTAGGTSFSLFAPAAERVELCLFDESHKLIANRDMPEQINGIWHGFVPAIGVGQRYGYRVHGKWQPEEGLRFNPAKLLIDPFAKRLSGSFVWSPAVFDYQPGFAGWHFNDQDSASFVPLSMVTDEAAILPSRHHIKAWSEAIIYELNVAGYSMRFPGLNDRERGKFAALKNVQVLEYIKSLGITSIELQPVHEFIDESFLTEKGLQNFWGYNSINFFSAAARYAHSDPLTEFQAMVSSIHDAGLEVILDVAYNHTGEGGEHGPTIGFRGIDNLAYYRTEPNRPGTYINDTGCGNTLDADQSQVQELVIQSLRYWHHNMGVDGFRFDLATILGRSSDGFHRQHPLLSKLERDPDLQQARLIAEPWDPGPGGYQLGAFSGRWSEWNDRFRDSCRSFWRGDKAKLGAFVSGLHGSSELFSPHQRPPQASINFITAHDGFTLSDLVSYEHRHNEANGENNRDGHGHNLSQNFGIEGPTDDPQILELRRRQRLNLLATLLTAQGVPMLLAGDEFGNSQCGNNNAYAQNNEMGWLDWTGLESDPGFTDDVRKLIALRQEWPLLRQPEFLPGNENGADGLGTIHWLSPGGHTMREDEWQHGHALMMHLRDDLGDSPSELLVCFNAWHQGVSFRLPHSQSWQVLFASCGLQEMDVSGGVIELDNHSLVILKAIGE